MKFKNFLFSILLITACSANAQVRFFFGPSPSSAAEETKAQMDKLIKKSYIFTFYAASDSIADSTLIHDIVLMGIDYSSYCLLYKDDTTHVAVSITKLKNGDFILNQYLRSRNIKRSEEYTKGIIKTGKWYWYYDDRWLKRTATYNNGKRDGTWKYYDNSGNKTNVEYYQNGILIKSLAK